MAEWHHNTPTWNYKMNLKNDNPRQIKRFLDTLQQWYTMAVMTQQVCLYYSPNTDHFFPKYRPNTDQCYSYVPKILTNIIFVSLFFEQSLSLRYRSNKFLRDNWQKTYWQQQSKNDKLWVKFSTSWCTYWMGLGKIVLYPLMPSEFVDKGKYSEWKVLLMSLLLNLNFRISNTNTNHL